jgi:uncharacterized protein YodC (DUF2158 family)
MWFYHERQTRGLGLRPTCDMPYTGEIDGRWPIHENEVFWMGPNRLQSIRGTKMELETKAELAKLAEDYIEGKLDAVSDENVKAVEKLRQAFRGVHFDELVRQKCTLAEERRPVLTSRQAVPGTLVRLRSGSPVMTLEGVESTAHVYAVWFESGKRRHASFHISALVLVRGIPQE